MLTRTRCEKCGHEAEWFRYNNPVTDEEQKHNEQCEANLDRCYKCGGANEPVE